MQKTILILLALLALRQGWGQPRLATPDKITLPVVDERGTGMPSATVELLRASDSALVRTGITDSTGIAVFEEVPDGRYLFRVSNVNYQVQHSSIFQVPLQGSTTIAQSLAAIVMKPAPGSMQGVTVIAKKPFIQQLPGKTIVNVDAAITNAGTTAMEVLEKSPGVTVDKDGNISLRGRSGVMIMIDNKPAYVSGTDLVNLLNGMSSSQVESIELITNPSAQYDAAGNAGIINIRTKKNKQRGFNGTANLSYGQGRYYKSNHSLQLNYREGKWNYFLNYSMNDNKGYTDMFALRTYYNPDRTQVESRLEQPSDMRGHGSNRSLRTGVDLAAGKKTTIGMGLTGMLLSRTSSVDNTASWIDANGTTDSVIHTQSSSTTHWKNAGVNVNFRHRFSATQELSADVDYLVYDIKGSQAFQNNLVAAGGYEEAFKGELPSDIHIFAVKADHSLQLPHELHFESGIKSSRITTDNIADYYFRNGGVQDWQEDLGKTNHFLYEENIYAAYSNLEKKVDRWTLQTGLRYELTKYHANQLGNSLQKDSAFSRNYNSLFPSASINWEVDSSHTLMLSAGRRIDRPAFQKLNPFLYIINKYTYQQGNALIRPQYTWNLELSHVYKNKFTTTLGYGITRDYFSQLFLSNPDGTIIYTEGNFSRMRNISVQLSAMLNPASWWSINAQGNFNHKRIEGQLWQRYVASIAQANFSMNNQFKFKHNWSAELSGFYITKNQNDIQEVLEPTGQLSTGVAKQLWKNKATLRLTLRDIFYTQKMEGLTNFKQATEYFILKRDTRVATIGFVYRFGKSFKSTVKRSAGGAGDEIDRVGSGN